MNEKDLKYLFSSSVKNNHIINNNFFPTSEGVDSEIKIIEEGYFRSFDLVIAVLHKREDTDIKINSIGAYDHYYNLLMRTELLTQFADREKYRIDWIRFYPVELKSDNDILDKRLPNQILDAILTFGRSVLVLDEKHSRRVKKNYNAIKLLPATTIGYTGKDDYFEILSIFNRLVTNSLFNIPKRKLMKILMKYEFTDNPDKIFRCLANIQRINQKIAFSQLYNEESPILTNDEEEFLQKIVDIQTSSDKKQMRNLIKQTTNRKITDYT